jgi:hypothetical protein
VGAEETTPAGPGREVGRQTSPDPADRPELDAPGGEEDPDEEPFDIDAPLTDEEKAAIKAQEEFEAQQRAEALKWAFEPGEGAIELFDGIRLYKEEERLVVRGRICLKSGPTLELMGCTERGKTHESLLLFQCSPKQLHLALVMLGLEPTPQVGQFGEQKSLERGEKVVLEVTWAEADAPPEDTSGPAAVEGRITRRAEDLIYDQRTGSSMPRVGWVFTGSRNIEVPKPPDWDTKHEVYAAEYAGNVAAVYHDPDALLDTPLAEGGDDTIYVAYSARLPERGTKVLLSLRKWREEDGPGQPPSAEGVGEGQPESSGADGEPGGSSETPAPGEGSGSDASEGAPAPGSDAPSGR